MCSRNLQHFGAKSHGVTEEDGDTRKTFDTFLDVCQDAPEGSQHKNVALDKLRFIDSQV